MKSNDYLNKIKDLGSNYGLERTERLLALLDNPHKSLKLIHIAGTNGKGSTANYINNILMECGYKVGLFTSPYIEDRYECIQINKENIKEDNFIQLLSIIKEKIDILLKEGYEQPTEFEILTVLMLLYFKNSNVDFGIIEVGLGGRQDSTNVIKGILQIITPISLDHCNILGNTIEEIATEKAGIIKDNVPTVIHPQEENVINIIKEKCYKMNSSLTIVDICKGKLIKIIEEKEKMYQKVKFTNDLIVDLPLLGKHQIENLTVALEAIHILANENLINVNDEAISSGIKNTVWPGRFEIVGHKPLTIIDGAHNLHGIQALNENMNKYIKYNKLYLIVGILGDKDVENMVKLIAPKAQEVFCIEPNNSRAESADKLCSIVNKYNNCSKYYSSYEDAYLNALHKCKDDDLILVCGSLYMIGEMRKIIQKNKSNVK